MKKKLSLLSLLLIALFLIAVDIQAQKAKTGVDSALLYRITGKHLKKPSYIFGTLHLICPKDMFPAETLKGFVNQTGQLVLEVDLDDPLVLQKAAKGAVMADGKTVKDYLKPEEYTKVDELFKNYLGISYDRLQTLKPNLVGSILLRSPKIIGCAGAVAYDNFLVETATANKMTIIGLETVEAEFAAIDSQPFEKQLEGLNKTAANPEKSFDVFKGLYKIYLTQNSNDLYDFILNQDEMDGGLQEKLLNERNAAWIPVIEKNISVTASFIGVGGAHLGGKKGVVNLLRAKGYKLTPIKL